MHLNTNTNQQAPLHTCKAYVFQVDPDTRKTWLQLSVSAVNVQIFHDSVKNVYRILSVDSSKVLINTIITNRMSFTKTSQKFCQWVDSKANRVYGLGFATENDLIRFFNKFIAVREAARNTVSQSESVNTRRISRPEIDCSYQSSGAFDQLKQENTQLRLALAQSSNNAKNWQEELDILRSNNAKLITALQESHANVDEWKRQLHFYRDECTRLRLMMFSHHPSGDGSPVNDTKELKISLDSVDLSHKEQEHKILQLKNQVQRYTSQISLLKERLNKSEAVNQNLRNDLQKCTLQDSYSSRTASHSSHRNLHQLIRLRELFETKTNDFNQTLKTRSQDLQRLCSQITHTITEF